LFPRKGSIGPPQQDPAILEEPRDPLKLARYYRALLDSGRFESRAALARYRALLDAAPWAARAMAVARPIPEPAPVTRAILPATRPFIATG